MIKVSIIVPVYNSSLLIKRCLESIFNQKGDFNKEIIVIDDGSTDKSVEIVKTFDYDVILISQMNQGPAVARNQGIERATGKYLAFLDADDYWEPEFLETTVRFLEAHQNMAAVSTGQVHKVIGKEDSIMPIFLTKPHYIEAEGVILDDFYDFWVQHNHVCTGSVLMKTSIVKATGGQRTELRITEDLEFWNYLATFGKWGFIPRVLFVSDGGEVTKQQGWWAKNKKRWESAPNVEDWARRIEANINADLLICFVKAKGKIAKNLAYAMLMSKRQGQARSITLTYGKDYPIDKIAFLMRICSKTKLSWFVLAKLMLLKERVR